MQLPVDIKAVIDEATNIDEARRTTLSVSVYLDDSAPGDVQAHVRQAFACLLYTSFMNNVAQAVEIMDALDRCADLCRKLAEPGAIASSSLPVPFEVKAGRAVGFTEAPRGALFHDLTLDAEGRRCV